MIGELRGKNTERPECATFMLREDKHFQPPETGSQWKDLVYTFSKLRENYGISSICGASSYGNRILAGGLILPLSRAVCSCPHAPPCPYSPGSSGDQRRKILSTKLYAEKETLNMRSHCAYSGSLDIQDDYALQSLCREMTPPP